MRSHRSAASRRGGSPATFRDFLNGEGCSARQQSRDESRSTSREFVNGEGRPPREQAHASSPTSSREFHGESRAGRQPYRGSFYESVHGEGRSAREPPRGGSPNTFREFANGEARSGRQQPHGGPAATFRDFLNTEGRSPPQQQSQGGSTSSARGEPQKIPLLSVGRLASLLKLQGCQNYSQINLEHLSGDLRELVLARPRHAEIREGLQEFWTELAGTIKPLKSRARSRSLPKRRKQWPKHAGAPSETDAYVRPEDTDPFRAEVEKYLKENDIDDNASKYFRGCTVDVQRMAIQVGSLRLCRNPSSALMRRCLDAKRQPGVSPASYSVGSNVPLPGAQATPMASGDCSSSQRCGSSDGISSEAWKLYGQTFPIGSSVATVRGNGIRGKVVGYTGEYIRLSVPLLGVTLVKPENLKLSNAS